MKILLTGASGLIGQELGKFLFQAGHQLRVVSRRPQEVRHLLAFPAEYFPWAGAEQDFPMEALKGVEAVINLAGEPIGAGRWSARKKLAILNSRVMGAQRLTRAISRLPASDNQLHTIISASAIGYYGNSHAAHLTEEHPAGKGFLAEVCQQWEEPFSQLSPAIRVVHPRIGIVLARQGGALEKMLPLFSAGLGGKIGKGRQWMSWIHLRDLCRLMSHCLEDSAIRGPVNAVAPAPVSNADFSAELARALGRRTFLPVPPLALRLALGEMSTLILEGQHVSSSKIEQRGFVFDYPHLPAALNEICAPLQGGQLEIMAEQWVPHPPELVFPFFCDEKNLERITPDFLNFKVLGKSTPEIQEQTIINYQLKLHGLPMRWRSRIESWQPGKCFVDTQLKGPYAKWHHLHEFLPLAGGTLLKDRVHYKLPFGRLGQLMAGPKVRQDVAAIFRYRRQVVGDVFKEQSLVP
jgi:uncharacterized protein